ncbi:MAG: PEGA domain-containing protein [Fidelibacterota bacterium]
MLRLTKILSLILLFLCSSVSAQENDKFKENTEEPKIGIAVLQLDNNGVTESEAKALTDRLRLEIFQHDKFEVMERQKMNSILDEMQFQLSDCTSDECAIEIGRMIGVAKMVAGSVSKVGEYYTVSARIIDMETSRIELTAVVDMEGTLGMVLTKAIPAIARQLCQVEEGVPEFLTEEDKSGIFNVKSQPANANVYINNEFRGITPLELELAPNEKYLIKVSKEQYKPFSQIYFIEPGQRYEISVMMERTGEKPIITQKPSEEEKTPEISDRIEKKVEKPKSVKYNVFRIGYFAATEVDELNKHLLQINENIAMGNTLFNDLETPAPTDRMKSFHGLNLSSGQQLFGNVFLDFSLGILINTMEDNDQHYANFNEYATLDITYGLGQAGLDLKLFLFDNTVVNPFLLVGGNYNFMVVDAKYDDEAIGGVFYQGWGFRYGGGVELRIANSFGISGSWHQQSTTMELTEIGDDAANFEQVGMSELEPDPAFFKVQLNFYSNK